MSKHVGNHVISEDEIDQLKGAERIRQRPSTVIGSAGIDGAFHCVKETIGNAMDEAARGFGKHIKVTVHKDGSLAVRDYGRGVPLMWNEKNENWNWFLIYAEMYAGSNYGDRSDKPFTIGTNGLGAAATQYTSEWFNVYSFRSGTSYKKHFKKGYAIDPEAGPDEFENTTGETGTLVEWKLDSDVFSSIDIPISMFKNYCEFQAHLNSLDFELYDEANDETFFYHGEGAEPYLKSLIGDSFISMSRYYHERHGHARGTAYRADVEIMLAVVKEMRIPPYLFSHNTSKLTLSDGMHAIATQVALADFFKKIGKSRGVTIDEMDYKNFISLAIISRSTLTDWKGQTKDYIGDDFMYDMVYKGITEMLNDGLHRGDPSITKLVEDAVSNADIRRQLKEYESIRREAVKATNSKKKSEKFAACDETNPKKRELWIPEGDSAMGAIKAARDSTFQAIQPLRGKLINCLKSPIEKALQNPIIKDLISAIGTGIEIPGNDMFNMDDLAYDKLIVATDADVDGFQIRVLVFTFFWRFAPRLLKEGKVFIAETPLFTITTSQGVEYAYTDAEKDSCIEELRARGVSVKKIERSKGLGSNNKEMTWETTMCPDTRRLVPLQLDTDNIFVRDFANMLFGKDISNGRKGFVYSLLGDAFSEVFKDSDILSNVSEDDSFEAETFEEEPA